MDRNEGSDRLKLSKRIRAKVWLQARQRQRLISPQTTSVVECRKQKPKSDPPAGSFSPRTTGRSGRVASAHVR